MRARKCWALKGLPELCDRWRLCRYAVETGKDEKRPGFLVWPAAFGILERGEGPALVLGAGIHLQEVYKYLQYG